MNTIKEFYCQEFPTDSVGIQLDSSATFGGLLLVLFKGENLYSYIGVTDSIVRERLLTELSRIMRTGYDYVYNLYLNSSHE